MRERGFRGRRQLLPRTLRSSGERREYLVSFGLVALLQAAITAALAVCAAQTYRMWQQGVAYVAGEIGRMIPVLLLLGAGIAAAVTLRTVRRIRAVLRLPLDDQTGDPETRR